MVRHKRSGIATALTGAAVLITVSVAAPVPADAATDRGAPPAPSPSTRSRTQIQKEAKQALVKQITKDHHISAAEARRRADRQPAQLKLASKIRKDLGTAYGGAWIDQKHGGKLTIGVTEATKATAVPKARTTAEASGMSDTNTTTVKYSFRHLQHVSAALAKRVGKANKGAENGLQTGIITSRNVVKLNSLRGAALTPAQRNVLRWAEHEFGDAVQTGTYAQKSVPKYCYDDYACDPPLRSGLAIFTNGARCTSAFSTYSGGRYYMLTAGHCAEIGYWWDVSTYSYGYQNVGGVANYTFGWYGDSAIISVDNPSWWQPRGWVLYTTPVYGSESDYVGGYVCKQGSTTGYTCGTVTEVDATVSYPNRTLAGMTWSTACDGPGDSGSGVFYGNYAHGILSGGPNSGCGMIHEPIGRALSTWGVSLLSG
ncbi:S1 family peptidase [Actinomadura latina]|uniref:Protease n=1 Tax=Actinomadura latina TaxID=163603 RepID=A0A846Z5N4_9ACTN|nr:S1 family peptidase [Actinomadura latina]NKZ05506.1 protease [Actinomadura latina]